MSTVTTYVRYLLPGTFFPEEAVREVSDRDRDAHRAAREAPGGAFAFTFYDVVTDTAEVDGKTVTLRSGAINETGRYYIDAEQLTAADVKALLGEHSILLSNMRANGWDAVLRCNAGNFQPLKDEDVLISTEGTS